MVFSKKFKWLGIAAIAAIGYFGSNAHAASVLYSGESVDGWTVTFTGGISLVDDGGNTLTLEKFAAFTPGSQDKGLVINFTKTPGATVSSDPINIVDEAVTNLTGEAWTGFQFIVASTNPSSPAKIDSTFSTGSISPFTTSTESADGSTVTLSGGSLASGSTGLWGFDPGSPALSIGNLSAQSSFSLKEIPLSIPLPSAAWSGLSGLGLIGLAGLAKKARRRHA